MVCEASGDLGLRERSVLGEPCGHESVVFGAEQARRSAAMRLGCDAPLTSEGDESLYGGAGDGELLGDGGLGSGLGGLDDSASEVERERGGHGEGSGRSGQATPTLPTRAPL